MKRSAGVLLYRHTPHGVLEVLLAHMGGPLWQHRSSRAWSIPKGELEDGDDARSAALREFEEELGSPLPPVELVGLGEVTQAGGKHVTAFAGEADFDVTTVRSTTFAIEWPRGSGTLREFPEIDRAAWLTVPEARVLIVAGQVAFLDRLVALLGATELPHSEPSDPEPSDPEASDA